MRLLRFLLYLIIILIVGFAIFIGYISFTDYSPDEKTVLQENTSGETIPAGKELSLLIWNIGYGGLDNSMDFFYDGGQQVKPPIKNLIQNLSAVTDFVDGCDSIDFYLFQEVDVDSKRSYGIDQKAKISAMFAKHTSVFAKNYDVFFIPLPLSSPLGRVKSGLMTLSRFQPVSASRYSFPGNYSWPKSLFMLDRCFLVNRYKTSDNKELLVINTHNSAYDDGNLREQQMNYLKNFLTSEYKKGHYIIVGGDWNQCPPGFEPTYDNHVFDRENLLHIKSGYLPEGWTWLFDSSVPTNRRVDRTYKKGESLTTVIDFYLLSPNILPVSVETIDLDFQHSDHQPVLAILKLQN